MANQKISELTAIATIDNATDVLPIVDTSATTTKKITLTQVKTSLALNNVDNTSDANKPISSATQTALDLKVDENAAITGATKTKVTYDAKGLVTAGADATTADIADSLNKRYVTDANLTVIGNTSGTNTGDNATNSQYSGLAASKQDTLVSATNIKTVNSTSLLGSGDVAVQATLVSGTNIKTINSTSLLGSGDIVLSASPSGVSGAIQFSNGSAFASDATNLFWDDTNNRLGVGTNAPSATGHFKGSGSTSATTSLLVQNSAGSQLLKITDDGSTKIGGNGTNAKLYFGRASDSTDIGAIEIPSSQHFVFTEASGNGFRFADGFGKFPMFLANGKASVNKNAIADASAQFEVVSTTGGMLPPRMTTTEKNAITSPAAGLVVYDNTTNKLQCYNGSTWNDLF
jgi:hypothetical protein